jgi:hypothetical protein
MTGISALLGAQPLRPPPLFCCNKSAAEDCKGVTTMCCDGGNCYALMICPQPKVAA